MRSCRCSSMIVLMQQDIAQVAPSAPATTWGRAFASLYDPFLWTGERAGVRQLRRTLLGQARGRTVDIGSGSGLNLPHFPDHLDELVLAEPDPAMRARLTKRLDRSRSRARLIDAPAEQLPFADHSIDTVVSSFVLCTVTAPDLALREIARVLRHDGQLLFIEHVRSDSPTLARWQDRLDKPWRCFARGCRCNRATAELIVACGFELATLRVATWRAMPPIVRPLVIGRAQPRSNGTAETGSPVDHALSATGTGGSAMTSHVRVGLFPAALHLDGGPEPDAILRRLGDADVDHLCVGDHVSFFVGAGSDGLITAASLLAAQAELPVYVGLYLLPLRHPVLVARQLATLTELAPGRLTLGVGVGGEDRHELEICGVDPTTRGRRMDESLRILRALADGNPLSFDGEFFTLHDALITPALTPRIPLIVGGRSPAAARRAATLGDGWLGIWVSPRRYATTLDHIAQQAAEAGRDPNGFQHALNVWCGFGPTREAARTTLATRMQTFYQMPFEPFERYSPHGTPAQVAEFLSPYVEAGCTTINVIACADNADDAIAAVGELRERLTTTHRCPAIP